MRISFKFATIITIIISIFQLSTGCGGGDRLDTYLDRAERIMDEAPDSAHAILADSITPQLLASASERQAALHALLLTQSEFKIYQPSDNDSIISSAVQYFENTNEQFYLMLALYYQARIRKNIEDNSTAMSILMRVRSIAMDLDNIFWQARAADVISQILSASYYHEEAVNFTEEAADLYKSCGRENFYLYAMGNLALLYSRLRQSDKCLSIIDSLKNHTEKYLPLKLEFMGLAHLMYEMRGEYDKAEQYGDSMLQYVDEIEYLATDLADIAYVKIELGKLEEAKSLLNISAKNLNSSTDSIFFFDSMIQLYTKEGNLTKVIECLKQLSDINNARFKKAVRQSAMVGQRNFFLEESIRTKKTAQRNRQLFIFSSIITFLLLIIGSLIYRNRLNKKNADISKRMTEIILLSKKLEQTDTENYSLNQKLAKHGKDIENLSTLLSERNNEIQILSANLTRNIGQTEQLSLMVQTLLQGRFAHLNTIITEYAVQDENETNYLAFYKNIKHEIDKFKRPENIQEIERMVDDCLDGIISKIRTQIPTMREKDITLISLTLAGLNARAIGLFLGIHPNYTYRRKKQLIKIIADSSAPNAPEIVETLSRY